MYLFLISSRVSGAGLGLAWFIKSNGSLDSGEARMAGVPASAGGRKKLDTTLLNSF